MADLIGSNGPRVKPVIRYGAPGEAPAQSSRLKLAAPSVPSSPHDPIDVSGEQKFCSGYGEWSHVIRKNERSIIPDLDKFGFGDDIKNQADVIYNKMTPRVRRGKIREQMLFYCVYCAHLELNRDVNPISLGEMFNLDPGAVQRCDSMFSPLQTGYRPPSSKISPLRYLPSFCEQMGLSTELAAEMAQFALEILTKDPKLYQENPQTVAAGILRYYTVINGIDDLAKIKIVTSRSIATIDTMYERVSHVHNI